jgi:hypothetical protein
VASSTRVGGATFLTQKGIVECTTHNRGHSVYNAKMVIEDTILTALAIGLAGLEINKIFTTSGVINTIVAA